jgi:hypothetical protein
MGGTTIRRTLLILAYGLMILAYAVAAFAADQGS